ncbi:hypothetical protein SAMN02745866_00809 [Alteromonadaceae bacterium Bs31]|nr:hypothetical protein SAMN02745866_00809 [Alteromonadaceae bacterium Bs31]
MADLLVKLNALIGADNLTSILLLILLSSIFVNLFLLQKNLQAKKKKLDREKIIEVLKEFFTSQLNQSQNTLRHKQRKHFEKKVMRLRQAYLAIEKSCLDKGIDSQAYWQLLHDKLKQLLSIYEHHKASKMLQRVREKITKIQGLLDKAPEAESREKVSTALDKLEIACEELSDNPIRLAEMDKKLARLLAKLSNEFYRESSHISGAGQRFLENGSNNVVQIKHHAQTMGDIADNSNYGPQEDYGRSMSSMSEATADMRARIDELEYQLKQSRNKLELHMHAMDKAAKDDDLKSLSGDIRDVSDEIIEASEREIDRLNNLVKEKKSIIHELEDALSSVKKHEKDASPLEQEETKLSTTRENEIELLRRNLYESEQCILLLERELELLKESRDEALKKKQALVSEDEIYQLNKTIDSLKSEVVDYESAWREKDLLFGYVTDCLDASTAEDVSLTVYQCLSDMGFRSDMLINTAQRTLEINPQGAIPTKEKLIVNSMQVGEVNLSDKEKRFYFRFSNLGGLVRKNDGKPIGEKEKSNLFELFSLTDKILRRISQLANNKQSMRSIDGVSNSIKYLMKEIDESYDQVFQKIGGAVHDGFGQLEDVARSAGLNATQVASIKNLEKDLSTELLAEKRVKLRTHKSMLSLLQKVEKLND